MLLPILLHLGPHITTTLYSTISTTPKIATLVNNDDVCTTWTTVTSGQKKKLRSSELCGTLSFATVTELITHGNTVLQLYLGIRVGGAPF